MLRCPSCCAIGSFSRPAPVAPSRGAGTSDAPGGHAAANAEPPPMYWYPSFSSSFGQSIVDVVGRSRKSDALSILKAFDDSTRQAQDFMQKAVEYTSRANELMAKAHHECFTSMQKLLVDAHADKASFNKARRRARPRSEEPEAGGHNQMMTAQQTMMIQKPAMDVIAAWTTSRWNVKIQKMKFRNHRQRILITALQRLATEMMMPKTEALCMIWIIYVTCYTTHRLSPGMPWYALMQQ